MAEFPRFRLNFCTLAGEMTEKRQVNHYRFGVFEADASTGESRKRGVHIKLNVQPFQVLLMLLEKPGEILTREQISSRLWPEGTYVDFEHGVNSAVNRLREALGDRAKNPRFIETLARRGYRFVAPVEAISSDGVDNVSATTETDEAREGFRGRFLVTAEELPQVPHRTVRVLFELMQLMYLGFYVGALANLAEIEELLSALPRATEALTLLIATAALLIPVRVFLFCAVLFRAPGLRARYLRMWPFLLPFELLWSLAPFLLLHHINFGLALACVAPLVYAPFAQRALILMGAGDASG